MQSHKADLAILASENHKTMNEINKLRAEIDKIDQELLKLIVKRVEFVKQIGVIKNQEGIAVVDEEREKEIFNKLMLQAVEKGLDSDIVKKVWKVLIDISYELEDENGNR